MNKLSRLRSPAFQIFQSALFLIFFFGFKITFAASSQTQIDLNSANAALNNDRFEFIIAEPNTINPKKIMLELKPGQTAEEAVIIKNDAVIPVHFSLYGADAATTQQGSFSIKTRTAPQTSLGQWIQFKEPEIDLQPNEIRMVKFTVKVPENSSLGDFSGGIAAEKSQPDHQNNNITIAVRNAIRVDVKVTNNPQTVPKQKLNPPNQNNDNIFLKIYFFASLTLFIGCLLLLIINEYKTKKGRPAKNVKSSAKKP